MATPKGNFMAFQPLKPVEYKVGDIYNNMIDGMIKRGDAKKAAELKAAQEKNKYIGERFDKIKIDPFATTNNLTDAASKAFKDTYDYYSEQRRLANEDPANAYTYLNRAENAARDYLQTAKTLGDANFIKLANEKAAAATSDDYYQNSDDLAQYRAIANGTFIIGRDPETGNMTFNLPGSSYNGDDDQAIKMGSSQFLNIMTVLPEKNLLPTARKEITDLASDLAEEWKTNTDGNITKSWKDFADERAKSYFSERYGDYNEAYIPAELQQWSKDVLKKPIKSAEDYKAVIESKINMAKSLVEQNVSTDTRLTAAEQEGQNLSNKQKRKDLQPKQEDPLNGGSLTTGNVILNIKGRDGKTYNTRTQGVSYFVKGNTNDGKTPKVGITTYWNPNGGDQGTGGFSFAMNFPSKDGKEVVAEGVTGSRAVEILASNGIKKPKNIIALMTMQAQNSGLQNIKPEPFGKNFQNYNINFSTVNSNSENSEPQKKSLADKVRYKKP